jgi:membrane protein DedA with SNARE-associated domain
LVYDGRVETLRTLLLEFGYGLVFLGPLLENAGLPVPGDSALFWASFLAAEDHFRLEWLILLATTGAILGDNAGYWAGRQGGRPLLERWRQRWPWMSGALDRTQAFFARHGGKTVFLARFIPGLRVCGALVAGAALMPWRRFFWFNCAGAVAWATVTALLGYALGRQFMWVRGLTDRMWVAALVAAALLALLLHVQYRAARRLGGLEEG